MDEIRKILKFHKRNGGVSWDGEKNCTKKDKGIESFGTANALAASVTAIERLMTKFLYRQSDGLDVACLIESRRWIAHVPALSGFKSTVIKDAE